MHGSAWSLLPFLTVIPVAVVTRQVLPGLLAGLLIGAYMLHPTPLGGIQGTLSYILKELSVPDNLRLLVFLYGFGSFVGLVRITGGVAGFSQWMGRRIHSAVGAWGVTWVSAAATFIAPDFRIITVAPVMERVFRRFHVPEQKAAFVIDATATPLTALVPIGTAFVGYMVGLIGAGLRHQRLAGSAYHLLLLSLPFNFFAVLMLLYAFMASVWQRGNRATGMATGAGADNGLNHRGDGGEGKVHGRQTADDSAAAASPDNRQPTNEVERPAREAPPRLANLLLPLASLLALTLFLTWWDGHLHAPGLWRALVAANAASAMLEALFITLLLSFIWYAATGQPIGRILTGFLQGGNDMMAVNLLLILVWGVSAVSANLGFTAYTQRIISGLVPALFIAPVLFAVGCIISYVIGSSFGTWGMLLPLGFSLAASTHASVPLMVGAVFASGTFGGFASPLSDNTVAMATVLKLPLMDYARYKLKPGLLVAGACTVLYAGAGFVVG